MSLKNFFQKGFLLILIFCLGIFVSGCVQEEPISSGEEEEIVNKKEATSNVIEANNQFAFDLYQKYQDQEEGNIFFSPYSISSALAMTYEGARSQTAQEMQSVFHFPLSDNIRRTGYSNLYQEINKEGQEYELSTANALWAEEEFDFLEEYFNLIEGYYYGKANNLSFKNNPEDSRLTINDWIEEQTKEKIKNLIPSGVINSLTRLVLTNAIYFKGEWVQQFDSEKTREENFYVDEGRTIQAEMMSQAGDEAEFNYFENENLQVLEIPYSGEDLSMLVLLPRNKDLSSLENSLSRENISLWRESLKEQRVDIYIPKFRFETKYFMKGDLMDMGMPTAFSGNADFSGMTGEGNLFISEVIHQAFVEVNEEGTEAAAATAVVMELKSVGPGSAPPIFRADHPFIFIIQQKNSGNILFMGRVSEPIQE